MPLETDGVALNPLSADPTTPSDGEVWFRSILGEPFVQRQGSPETLLTPPSHGALDDLRHVAAETGVVEDTLDAWGNIESRAIRTAASPGGVIIRRWSAFTFDAEGNASGYTLEQFDPTGGLVQTLTVTRTGSVWEAVLS